MSKSKKRAFLSSTFKDLEEYRKEAIYGILSANHEPVAMEIDEPANGPLATECLKQLATCQVYIGIVAFRYGTRPAEDNPDNLSITQIEWQAAMKLRLERHYFFASDEKHVNWPASIFEEKEAAMGLRTKMECDLGRSAKRFKTPDELRFLIEKALSNAAARPPEGESPLQDPLGYLTQIIDSIAHEPLIGYKVGLRRSEIESVSVDIRTIPHRGGRPGSGSLVAATAGRTLEEMMLDSQRLVLLGNAGSGKSTMLASWALKLARTALAEAGMQGASPKHIPVRIKLGEFAELGVPDMLDYASRHMDSKPAPVLKEAAKDGRIVYLLDGLDEVRADRRAEITSQIATLGSSQDITAGSRLVVTARAVGDLEFPTSFKYIHITPLDLTQQREIVKNLIGVDVEGRQRVEAVFAEIHSDEILRELAGNPLMLTLITMLFGAGDEQQRADTRSRRRPEILANAIDHLLARGRVADLPHSMQAKSALGHLALSLVASRSGSTFKHSAAQKALQGSREFKRLYAIERRWRDPQVFLGDVSEKTGIITWGPMSESWQFAYPAFRDRLASWYLAREMSDPWEPIVQKLVEGADDVAAHTDFFSMLASDLPNIDILIRLLASKNRDVAIQVLSSSPGGVASLEVVKAMVREGDSDHSGDLRQLVPWVLERYRNSTIAVGLLRHLRVSARRPTTLYLVQRALESIVNAAESGSARQAALRELDMLFDHMPWPSLPGSLLLSNQTVASFWCDVSMPLRPFRIGRIPITNEIYEQFDPRHRDQRWLPNTATDHLDDHPVVNVSWIEAEMFCRWLARAIPGVSLPTESQWNFAATAGDGRKFPWAGKSIDHRHAVFGRDLRSGGTSAAGSKPEGAGPFGALDQLGNVWEWCIDDHTKAGIGVLKGGSWYDAADGLRIDLRGKFERSDRDIFRGFRCVCNELPGIDGARNEKQESR